MFGQFQGDILAIAADGRIPRLKADDDDIFVADNWHRENVLQAHQGRWSKFQGCKTGGKCRYFFQVFANPARFTMFAGTLFKFHICPK